MKQEHIKLIEQNREVRTALGQISVKKAIGDRMRSYAYHEHVVLFVDLLGFSQLIRSSVSDPNGANRVARVVSIFHDSFLSDSRTAGRLQIAQFSDSIVVSVMVDREVHQIIGYVVEDVVECQAQLLLADCLCRGAMVVGDLCHEDRHLFGPAMVTAYEWERSAALYPRIIIPPSIVWAMRNANNDLGAEGNESSGMSYYLVESDSDGIYYIDYFNFNVFLLAGRLDEWPNYLRAVWCVAEKLLGSDSPSLKVKGRWLVARYASAIEKFKREFAKMQNAADGPLSIFAAIEQAVDQLPKLKEPALM